MIDVGVNERKSESYVLNAIIPGPHRICALVVVVFSGSIISVGVCVHIVIHSLPHTQMCGLIFLCSFLYRRWMGSEFLPSVHKTAVAMNYYQIPTDLTDRSFFDTSFFSICRLSIVVSMM